MMEISCTKYNMIRLIYYDENLEIKNKRNKFLMLNIENYINDNIITSSIVNDIFFQKICRENNIYVNKITMDLLDVFINASPIIKYNNINSKEKCIKVDINMFEFYKIILPANFKLFKCKCNNKNLIGIMNDNNTTIYGGDFYNLSLFSIDD